MADLEDIGAEADRSDLSSEAVPMTDMDDPEIARWAVWRGFITGDLGPLREFLEKGHNVDRDVSAMLLDALTGEFGFTLSMRRGKPGKGTTWYEKVRASDRNLRIGLYVERRASKAKPGEYEAILREAMSYFGVSRGKVNQAVTYLRRVRLREEEDLRPICVESIVEEFGEE